MGSKSDFVRAVCNHAFGKEKREAASDYAFIALNENGPHFPESILKVHCPDRFRNKEMGNTDSIEEKFEIAEALASRLEKSLKEIKKEVVKRPLPEANVAPVPDCQLDGLLKERMAAVSGFAAQLKETPVAKKRVVLQRLTEVVDLLKSDYNPC